jgi:hypothetical protein
MQPTSHVLRFYSADGRQYVPLNISKYLAYYMTSQSIGPLSRCPEPQMPHILYINLVLSYLCQSDNSLLVNLHVVLSVGWSHFVCQQVGYLLFWNVPRCRLVVICLRFETTYRVPSHKVK